MLSPSWEILYNPNFKPLEFEGFKKQAGANAFTMSPKKWIETTNAIGIVSKAGRYGGTYAHSDIAMSFATWRSFRKCCPKNFFGLTNFIPYVFSRYK